jgi:class 3 adenylate cyclase
LNFTGISQKLSPEELVDEIDYCFKQFDHIVDKYNLEKIKTIGDSYMAAGGVPVPGNNDVLNTVLAGLEMQQIVTARKESLESKGKPAFEMRVGINTGQLVAGIVGIKKFQYDLWGDTVNTASRIESTGEPGKVNIGESTYAQIKDEARLNFEPRGKIQAKGKGEIEMYFVSFKK